MIKLEEITIKNTKVYSSENQFHGLMCHLKHNKKGYETKISIYFEGRIIKNSNHLLFPVPDDGRCFLCKEYGPSCSFVMNNKEEVTNFLKNIPELRFLLLHTKRK